jgi:hypothetical protein
MTPEITRQSAKSEIVIAHVVFLNSGQRNLSCYNKLHEHKCNPFNKLIIPPRKLICSEKLSAESLSGEVIDDTNNCHI